MGNMGHLSHHMDALAQDVFVSARERKNVVGEIKAQTDRLLAAFGRARTMAAEAVATDVSNHGRARDAERRARSRDVARMLQGFRRDHHHMGRTLHAQLSRTTAGVATHVASRLTEFDRERGRVSTEQRRMAENQRDALAEDLRRRSEAVAGLIEDFRMSRRATAQDVADRLEAFVNEVQSYVSGLLADARAFRAENGREMARELARTLTEIRTRTGEIAADTRNLMVRCRHGQEAMAEEFRNRLADLALARHTQVRRLLDDVRSWRQDLRSDLETARRLWHRLPEARAGAASPPRRDEAGAARHAGDARKAQERQVGERDEAEAARKRKAEEERRAKEAWAKMSDEKKILHVIRAHADGLTASRIGEIVDLHPSVVGRLATELVEQGKVGKNESTRLYFPFENE